VLRESNRPIVFVAGATGFAPVKSMVEDAFHRGLKRPIHLYWGVRAWDLYLPDLPEQWAARARELQVHPGALRTGAGRQLERPHRPGARSHPADFPSLAGNEIYACGSVKMVEAIFPKLKGQGAEEGMCFSDAFTISARSMAFQPKG
jgi:CDP-4-dehydro-6-deoxyglucose reductase